MTEFITLGTCETCEGAGRIPHSDPGGTYGCTYCDGSGVRKARGHGGYKTAAGAARALANRTGVKCDCDNGRRPYPDTINCWHCSAGVVVVSALPGQAWPEDATSQVRYANGRGEQAKAYADAVTIVVKGENRAGTWNESFLGLGSIVSVTDYGDVFDGLVKAAREERLDAEVERVRGIARERLAEGTQWVKLTRPDGTLATHVVMTVHRNGYTVQAAGTVERVAVPPTYTPEVLNAPV